MVDLERLRDNLKYIRRSRGLTFAKLVECQYVMEALGDVPPGRTTPIYQLA